MREFHASVRRCATCRWWEGERLAGSAACRVRTPRHAEMGFCRSPQGWWVDRPRLAESLCVFWEPCYPLPRHAEHRIPRALPTVMSAAPPPAGASHVLLVEPVHFRFNRETRDTNAFQVAPAPGEAEALADLAVAQHHALRDLLVANGVTVTVTRSSETTPDGPFCNNWFSTHPADQRTPATLVLYPLLATNRRGERRADLVALLRPLYPRVVDLSPNERQSRFLESTGSLVLDHPAHTAYAALSPRTDFSLASEWAAELDYHLVAFTAVDRGGMPYYHTNVMMFVGHGLAGVCLEAIRSVAERRAVEDRLRQDGREVLVLSQEQAASFCGNCLALAGSEGEPLFVMSSQAQRGFTPADLAVIERHGRILHTELSAFERLGGGSARCLIAELF